MVLSGRRTLSNRPVSRARWSGDSRDALFSHLYLNLMDSMGECRITVLSSRDGHTSRAVGKKMR